MLEIEQISNREFMVGRNRLFLAENNIVHVEAVGDQNLEIAGLIFEANSRLTSLIKGKVKYLINLNEAGKNPPSARNIWNKINENAKTEKVAIFGMHPVAKILAAFVINFSTSNHIKFFSSKKEAMNYLLK